MSSSLSNSNTFSQVELAKVNKCNQDHDIIISFPSLVIS